MKILVTGTAGFIGYYLTKKLCENNFEVIGLDNINDYYDVNLKYARLANLGINREAISDNNMVQSTLYPNLKFVKSDISDNYNLNKVFEKEGIKTVINLAAQAGVRYSIENPSAYVQSNLVGFNNIIECCRNFKIEHLLYASSSSVYGHNKKIPFSETDNVDNPVSLYAATKKSNELVGYTYSHLFNLRTTGLRFFTVYGPWGRPDMAPMLFADAMTSGKSIKVFNNGEMKRDFTYVDDIVQGIYQLLQSTNTAKPPAEIFNIGNSKPIDLMEFIVIMEEEFKIKAEKEMLPMQPGDVKITYADTSKLEAKTGYKPTTSLKQGLGLFVEWYKDYNKC